MELSITSTDLLKNNDFWKSLVQPLFDHLSNPGETTAKEKKRTLTMVDWINMDTFYALKKECKEK